MGDERKRDGGVWRDVGNINKEDVEGGNKCRKWRDRRKRAGERDGQGGAERKRWKEWRYG